MPLFRQIVSLIAAILLLALLVPAVFAQGNYRAQLRGVVSDSSGALLTHAKVTIRDEGTNVSSSALTDEKRGILFYRASAIELRSQS